MKVLEDGSYELDDGTIVSADDVVKLHEKDKKDEDKDQSLEEGQCSGPILLNG